MINLLKTKWLPVALGTTTYMVTTWLCLHPGQQLARAAADLHNAAPAKAVAPSGPSWTFENPEMGELINELKEQREALRTRAAQLDELEARLKSERQEIY